MKRLLFCIYIDLIGVVYADSILFLPDPYKHNNTLQSYDNNPAEFPDTTKSQQSFIQDNQKQSDKDVMQEQKDSQNLQEFQELEEFKNLEEFHNLPQQSNVPRSSQSPQTQQTVVIPNDLT